MQYEYRTIRGRIGDRKIMTELNRLGAAGWRVNSLGHALGGGFILLERAIESTPISKSLEAEFHDAMVGIYHAAAAHGYRPFGFRTKVEELGGLRAAKEFISTSGVQLGLVTLQKRGLLAISMEALVLQERWQSLFTDDERRKARERLNELGYNPD